MSTLVALSPDPILRFCDSAGNPLVGGTLTTLVGGIPYPTYSDVLGQFPLPNPIVLNSRGEVATEAGTSTPLYMASNVSYTFFLQDAQGNTIWTAPNIQSAQSVAITQAYLGSLLYPQTASETLAGIVPSNLGYPSLPFADVRRYGCICDGVTDDTAALTTAFQAASTLGLALVLPYGYTISITDYVQILSNTTFYLLGTVQLNNRQSGLFTNGATNVSIYGNKTGTLTDSSVVANYQWNTGPNYAPAIHIRSSTNVVVDGVNFYYCAAGVRLSNSTQNWLPGINWTFTQSYPAQVKVQNCSMQFTEYSGCSGTNLLRCSYLYNYVYRCGDGGLWIISSQGCEIVGNHRISPLSVYADVLTYGQNSLAHPTTWQDQQGIEVQTSSDLLIADNTVENFAFVGIDVKQYCNRVLVRGNRLMNCEQNSIVARQGDAGNVGCNGKVTIIDNIISSHGYVMVSNVPLFAYSGAIAVTDTFVSEIKDNVIYSYQMTPGIVALGPNGSAGWMSGGYASNPQQASLTVTGNCIDFTAALPGDATEFLYTATTPGAIVLSGSYTSIQCNDNHIRTDRYYFGDTRASPSAAITIYYSATLGTTPYYPTSCSVKDNDVIGWGNTGIQIVGQPLFQYCGLSVTGNTVAGAGGHGIWVHACNYAVVSDNNIAQNNSQSVNNYGILLEGVSGTPMVRVTCCGNSITGGDASRGGNVLTYGICLNFCGETVVSNNVVGDAPNALLVTNQASSASIFTQGTTGFPRSGPASPAGTVTSYYMGEPYLDTAGTPTWYFASAGNSTTWAT